MPSLSETLSSRMVAARIDPNATVTTRSKAFILESVRFPVALSKITSATYAEVPTTATRTKS